MIIKRKTSCEEMSIEIIDKKNFTIEGQLEFSPYDPEKIGHLMNINMDDNNRENLLNAFHMACEEYEQIHNIAILLQTISICHRRRDLTLINPRIRAIKSVRIKSNRRWQEVYLNESQSYKEETFNLTKEYDPTVVNEHFMQFKSHYGGRRVVLSDKYASNKEITMHVIYEAGYHYKDIQKIPGSTLSSLKKVACQYYYQGYATEFSNQQKYASKGIV